MWRKIRVDMIVETSAKTKKELDALMKHALKGRYACDSERGSVEIKQVYPLPDHPRLLIR